MIYILAPFNDFKLNLLETRNQSKSKGICEHQITNSFRGILKFNLVHHSILLTEMSYVVYAFAFFS